MHANNRRSQALGALLLLLGTGGWALGACEPNILLFADDVGPESSSLYSELAGSIGAVRMPNLETNNLYNNAAYSAPQTRLQTELDNLKAAATSGCYQ